MGLDIRVPLGLLFLAIGGMMSVYGWFTRGSAIYGKSLGVDINLAWGLLMLVFGLGMCLLGRRSGKRRDSGAPSSQGEQGRASR